MQYNSFNTLCFFSVHRQTLKYLIKYGYPDVISEMNISVEKYDDDDDDAVIIRL